MVKRIATFMLAMIFICSGLCACNSTKELQIKKEVTNFFELDSDIKKETVTFLEKAKDMTLEVESDDDRLAYCKDVVEMFEDWEKNFKPYREKFNENYRNETSETTKEAMNKYSAFKFPSMLNYYNALLDGTESSLSLYTKVLREVNYMAKLFCGYEESWIPINF